MKTHHNWDLDNLFKIPSNMLLRWYYLLVLMVLPYVANHHLCTFNKRAIPGYNKSIWNHLVFDPPSREKDKRITQWWRIITTKYKLPWSLYFSKINQPINAYMVNKGEQELNLILLTGLIPDPQITYLLFFWHTKHLPWKTEYWILATL